MPPTGNQANVLRNVPDTVPEDVYWALQQVVSAWNGAFGAPLQLSGWNSASAPSLYIRNREATLSWAIQVEDDGANEYFSLAKTGLLVTAPIGAVNAAFSGTVSIGGAATLNGAANFNGAVTMASTLVVTISGATVLDLAASLVKIAASAGLTADVRIGETSGNVSIGTVNTDATDVFIGGTSSFVGITCSSMQINGGTPYTTTNPPVSSSVTGTYTGNGGVTQRQITTGFQVKSLILERVSTGSQWLSQNQSNSTFIGTGPTIQQQSAVHLHASNGFWVADGSVNGNTSGETFNYTVFR